MRAVNVFIVQILSLRLKILFGVPFLSAMCGCEPKLWPFPYLHHGRGDRKEVVQKVLQSV